MHYWAHHRPILHVCSAICTKHKSYIHKGLSILLVFVHFSCLSVSHLFRLFLFLNLQFSTNCHISTFFLLILTFAVKIQSVFSIAMPCFLIYFVVFFSLYLQSNISFFFTPATVYKLYSTVKSSIHTHLKCM